MWGALPTRIGSGEPQTGMAVMEQRVPGQHPGEVTLGCRRLRGPMDHVVACRGEARRVGAQVQGRAGRRVEKRAGLLGEPLQAGHPAACLGPAGFKFKVICIGCSDPEAPGQQGLYGVFKSQVKLIRKKYMV